VERKHAINVVMAFAVLDLIFLRWVFAHFGNWGFWDWDYQQSLLEVSRSAIVDYGQLPLWNAYFGGGVSLAGNTLNHVYAPSFLPVLLFGTLVGIKLCIFIYLAIAQAGSFLLARSRGLGPLEAMLTAIVFSLGAVYAHKLAHGQFEWIAIAWVPFVLLAVDRIGHALSARTLCGGSIFFALIILDGGPYQFALFGVFLGVYVLVQAIDERSAKPLAGFVAIGTGAVLLAAIKLLPVFELVSRYPRETTEDPFYGAPFQPGAIDLLYQMFLSRAQAHDPAMWMPYVLNVGSYVGLVPLLLALLACAVAFRKNVAWIASGGIALWLSLGSAAPVDLWHLLHGLPGFSMLRVPSRFNVYVLLAIAMLAGAGLQILRSKITNEKHAQLACVAIVVAVAANLAFVNGDIFKVAFSVPPLETQPRGDLTQHYAYSPFIARYQEAALYPVHPNWPSGSYPAVLENRGVRWAFKTVPFPSHALSREDAGYRGEAFFDAAGAKVNRSDLTPNRVRVETEGSGGLLRLNINYDPGWKSVGDVSLSVAEFDGTLAVSIPEGAQEVVLAYRPTSFYAGAAVSFVTLLAFAVACRRSVMREQAS
jgi:uncharacterized membrane protein YfhO